ncbi:MAG: 30S ribosomal protein S8, partial [Patescibacteria group bacterium]
QLLVKEGFLTSVAEDMVDGIKMIKVEVAYQRRTPVLTAVTITSRPSLRLYVTVDDIKKRARKGYKTFVLTTSKGVMTGKEAIKEGIGGELLFEVQ